MAVLTRPYELSGMSGDDLRGTALALAGLAIKGDRLYVPTVGIVEVVSNNPVRAELRYDEDPTHPTLGVAWDDWPASLAPITFVGRKMTGAEYREARWHRLVRCVSAGKRKCDWENLLVRSNTVLRNGVGEAPSGTLFTVLKNRSGLHLSGDPCACCGSSHFTRGVQEWDVTIVGRFMPYDATGAMATEPRFSPDGARLGLRLGYEVAAKRAVIRR